MWIRTCVFKLPFVKNFAPQVLHSYGFSPVWIRTCAFKWPFVENVAPQISHSYGFSPVWVRICIISLLFFTKYIPQVSHLNCFIFAWVHTFISMLTEVVTSGITFIVSSNSAAVFVYAAVELSRSNGVHTLRSWCHTPMMSQPQGVDVTLVWCQYYGEFTSNSNGKLMTQSDGVPTAGVDVTK